MSLGWSPANFAIYMPNFELICALLAPKWLQQPILQCAVTDQQGHCQHAAPC